MKKMIAIGLAGALATASVGATTQSAQASGGAIVTGVLIGLGVVLLVHHLHPFKTFGYATYSSYPSTGTTTTYSSVGSDHTAWCQANYRSYNLATDMFHGFDGLDHRCVSPAG